MTTRYIEIDSTYRNRNLFSKQGRFTLETNAYNISRNAINAKDPVSDEVIVAKWRNSNFKISSTLAETKIVQLVPFNQTDVSTLPSSSVTNLILSSIVDPTNSIGIGVLQPYDDYYYGAILHVDSPAQSARIISYQYIGSNKCLIKTESSLHLNSDSTLKIIDPSTTTNHGDNDDETITLKDDSFIFIPYGPPTEALTGSYLVDITTNTEYKIKFHDTGRNMITFSDDYSNPIGKTDELEIRKTIPTIVKREHTSFLNDYIRNDQVNRNDIIGFNLTDRYNNFNANIGDFVELQSDDTVLAAVSPIGSANKYIDFQPPSPLKSTQQNAYVGSTLRMNMKDYIKTSEDRIIKSYDTTGGVASLTLTAANPVVPAGNDAPVINITGGNGTGAVVTAHMPAFILKKITVKNGTNYPLTTTVSIDPPSGPYPRVQAKASFSGVSGNYSVTIDNPGRGYTTIPHVNLVDLTNVGTGAQTTATIYDGSLSFAVSGGTNYITTPTIIIGKPDQPGGTQATVSVTVVNGALTLNPLSTTGGSGYTKIPTIEIQSTSGANGVVTATLDAVDGNPGSKVAWLTVVNPGTGYTTPPDVKNDSNVIIATANLSNSIATVDEPYDNRLSSYDNHSCIIFTPTETRRIKDVVNMAIYPDQFPHNGPDIHLINYDGSPVPINPPPESYSVNPLTWRYFSNEPNSGINTSGHLTNFYVAIEYTPGFFHYGYIVSHVVNKKNNSLPHSNIITVNTDFAPYISDTLPIYIVGVKLETPFNRTPYPVLPIGRDRMSVLRYKSDYAGTLSQLQGPWSSGNIRTRYIVSLLNIVLPNTPISSSKGGYITQYPFIYVKFRNASSGSNIGESGIEYPEQLYSNNPSIKGKTFRVVIDNTVDDQVTKFVSLRSGDMEQTQILSLHDNMEFAVYLPDGSLFETYQVDTTNPYPPNKDIQISALFSLTPI